MTSNPQLHEQCSTCTRTNLRSWEVGRVFMSLGWHFRPLSETRQRQASFEPGRKRFFPIISLRLDSTVEGIRFQSRMQTGVVRLTDDGSRAVSISPPKSCFLRRPRRSLYWDREHCSGVVPNACSVSVRNGHDALSCGMTGRSDAVFNNGALAASLS